MFPFNQTKLEECEHNHSCIIFCYCAYQLITALVLFIETIEQNKALSNISVICAFSCVTTTILFFHFDERKQCRYGEKNIF